MEKKLACAEAVKASFAGLINHFACRAVVRVLAASAWCNCNPKIIQDMTVGVDSVARCHGQIPDAHAIVPEDEGGSDLAIELVADEIRLHICGPSVEVLAHECAGKGQMI